MLFQGLFKACANHDTKVKNYTKKIDSLQLLPGGGMPGGTGGIGGPDTGIGGILGTALGTGTVITGGGITAGGAGGTAAATGVGGASANS